VEGLYILGNHATLLSPLSFHHPIFNQKIKIMQQKNLIALAVMLLVACTSNETKETNTTTDSTASSSEAPAMNMHGYTPSYSARFETGSNANTEKVLSLYKAWDDNTLDNLKDAFSDSVYMYFWDGNDLVTTRDSMMVSMKSYRGNFASMATKLNAVVSVKESEKSEDWVLVWLNEVRTDKNGKVDSTQMQETWGLDKNGKVRTLYQYGQIPAKKEEKK
jgi:hypothetical protein